MLHPGAREPAGDLVGLLMAAGLQASAVAVYEVSPVDGLPAVAASALRTGQLDAVLLHSPKSSRTFARLAGAQAAALRACALSPACAAPLDGLALAGVCVATVPREDALLACLAQDVAPLHDPGQGHARDR